MATKVTIQNGQFQDAAGTAITGTLNLQLSQDAVVTGTGTVAPVTVSIVVTAGQAVATPIWGNDNLTPSGTVYVARLFDTSGALVWGPENWSITGAGPIEINTLTPSSAAVAYPTAIITNPSGDQTIATGNLTISNGLTAKSINAVQNAASFAGADIGAQVNAAITALGSQGGTVYIPKGVYSFSTTINLANNIRLVGAGRGATELDYTGSGIAVSLSSISSAGIEDLKITIANAAATAIKVAASNIVSIKNFRLGANAGGGTLLRSTGDGVSVYNSNLFIIDGILDSYTGIGINLDHTVDCHVSSVNIVGATNNTTSQAVIIDRGSSGVYFRGLSCGQGKNGLVVRDTSQGGTYTVSPWGLWFDQCLFDTTPGGDSALFDSTLATTYVDAHFTNCWMAAAGLNSAGAIITAGSCGVHISGGSDIFLTAGTRIRDCAGNGVLADNANVSGVHVSNCSILSCNVDNAVDQHGIYVNAAIPHVIIVGNLIGNLYETGHQVWGIKILNTVSDLAITGNELISNATGAIDLVGVGSNFEVAANTGAENLTSQSVQIAGNGGLPAATGGSLYVAGNLGSSVLGRIYVGDGSGWRFEMAKRTGSADTALFQFKDSGDFIATASATATTLTATGATPTGTGTNLGLGNTTGFGNGAAGTAVTTTLKNTGTGPATPQTIVKYLELDLGGTKYWLPLVQ